MTEPNMEPTQTGKKVAKFEIGKILAIVIGVVVIAGVASAFLSTSYFKGTFPDPYDCRCGDGVQCSSEQCDDGNKDNNDSCNNQCEAQFPICHYSQSGSYNVLWIDDSAVDGEGANDHSAHVEDILDITDVDGDGDEDDCNLAAL